MSNFLKSSQNTLESGEVPSQLVVELLNKRYFDNDDDFNKLKYLIKAGADLNYKYKQIEDSEDSYTALDFAFDLGNVKLIKLLLSNGAKLSDNFVKRFGEGLAYSVYNRPELTKYLLEQLEQSRINISKKELNEFILELLSYRSYPGKNFSRDDFNNFKRAIEAGADIKYDRGGSDTALDLAFHLGKVELVEFLLESDVRHSDRFIQDNDGNGLLYSLRNKYFELANYLLEQSIINISDTELEASLNYAKAVLERQNKYHPVTSAYSLYEGIIEKIQPKEYSLFVEIIEKIKNKRSINKGGQTKKRNQRRRKTSKNQNKSGKRRRNTKRRK